MQPQQPAKQDGDIDPPPFFNTWKGMYWLVLGVLACLILLFYAMTEAYS